MTLKKHPCHGKTDREELSVLRRLLDEQHRYFQVNPENAARFLAVGDHQPDASLDAAELAAWATVAEALFNFDETVTLR